MYLLFNIGGTHTRICTASKAGLNDDVKITDTPQDYDALLKLITSFTNEPLETVCGGLAGTFNSDHSQLISAPHILDLVNKPLKQDLEDRLKTTVYLQNDASLEGLAEAVKGAGQGNKIVGYICIGTGVGGVRVVDGHIDKTSVGFEPGHMIIDGEHTLEELVSGSALEKAYNTISEHINDPKVWDHIEQKLSIGLNNIVVEWSPDIIVIGGSVSEKIDLGNVKRYLDQLLLDGLPTPPLVASQLGQKSGLIGALIYLKNHK
jgi:predicted NBD/HSP70 family sugar kinase